MTYIYHTNLRGDIVSITDDRGTNYAQYNYDPWGNRLPYTGTLSQPFRYAGYYYDEETGLYYLKSRYYSPTLGRFLTKDAYGYINYTNPQTLNLYSYCNNNPVSNVDPNGNNYIKMIYNNDTGTVDTTETIYYPDGKVTLEYTDSQGNVHVGALNYIMHYYVRADLNSGLPQRLEDVPKDWISVMANLHRNGPGNEHNVKFVSPDGGRELIYNEAGSLVTDTVNEGTYNFISPILVINWLGHSVFDMVPYYMWGNGPNIH